MSQEKFDMGVTPKEEISHIDYEKDDNLARLGVHTIKAADVSVRLQSGQYFALLLLTFSCSGISRRPRKSGLGTPLTPPPLPMEFLKGGLENLSCFTSPALHPSSVLARTATMVPSSLVYLPCL